jgi:ABC-2 type transport system permease protein
MSSMTAPSEPASWAVIRLVAAREINVRLRDRVFLISSAVVLVLVAASVTLPLILGRNSDRPAYTVAALGPAATTVAEMARQAGAATIAANERSDQAKDAADAADEPDSVLRAGTQAAPPARITVVPVTSRAAAKALILTGDADAALVPAADGRLTVIGDREVNDDLADLISITAQSQQVLQTLDQAGVSTEVTHRLLTSQPPQQQLLEPKSANEDLAMLLSFLFAALFYFTSISFGLQIAQSVVEEKQSRVIEILVAAVPVRALLAGKVLGNAALALAQVVLLMAVGLGAASASGQSSITTLLLHSGGWFLLFFALGFTMLACLWAAAGALSARQEDLQATTLPLQMALIAPFLVSFYVTEPGTALKVLSYVPFTAPLSMPRRLLIGDAPWWEPLLAAAGMALTGALLVVLAARIYEGSLLRTATRTSIRAALFSAG